MEYRRFSDTFVMRLDRGEEVIASINALCEREGIKLGWVSAIGAVNEATLGCFDTGTKQYYSREYTGIYEIASLSGNISTHDGKPYLHIHAVLAGEGGTAFGGHLNRAVVSATCEVFIRVLDGQVGRSFSEEIGLNVMRFPG